MFRGFSFSVWSLAVVSADTSALLATWEVVANEFLPEKAERLRSIYHRHEVSLHSIFDGLTGQFDYPGFSELKDRLDGHREEARFTSSVNKQSDILPHCDKGTSHLALTPDDEDEEYPGGSIRKKFGFDMAEFMFSKMKGDPTSEDYISKQIKKMTALMMARSMVEVITGIIMDLVPPKLPPPVWIMRPFPCLPMLTGRNCLFSVLYPVSLPDFIRAHTIDEAMDGVLSSFPAKYGEKVGRTSNSLYRLCATAYIGMYCASIFKMCFMPMGVTVRMTFPVCFPQCFMVLAACPGFWFEDIADPCRQMSIPPFCSFSAFINFRRLPPQYVDFEETHPYPPDCPPYDEMLDIPDDLFEAVHPDSSPFLPDKEPPVKVIPADHPIIHKPPQHILPVHGVCRCAGTGPDGEVLCFVKPPIKRQAGADKPQVICRPGCEDFCRREAAHHQQTAQRREQRLSHRRSRPPVLMHLHHQGVSPPGANQTAGEQHEAEVELENAQGHKFVS